MSKVIVVGAGAAGMMAAYFAAKNKNKVTLIEKNEKTGKKIYITWQEAFYYGERQMQYYKCM